MEQRKYSNEFKLEAVRMCEVEDISVRQVAKELGISENTLYGWVAKYGKQSDGSRVTPDEHEELIRLRREVRRLREEREILKKATIFFMKERE